MISGESQHQTVAESSHGRLRSQHADRDSMAGAGSISRLAQLDTERVQLEAEMRFTVCTGDQCSLCLRYVKWNKDWDKYVANGNT